jgi:hypothetical protein
MLRLLKSTFFTLFPLFIFGIFSLNVHAQLDDLTLRIDPLYPRQNSTVTATIESTSVDIDAASVYWTVDGKSFKKGTGIKSIQVKTGKAGSVTKIGVTVSGTQGTFTDSVTIRPADVSLVWKTDGYIPPFYKGKALQTYGSTFTVTAIPEFFTGAGVRMNPKSLIYTWKKNGTIDSTQSGYGKDSFKSDQSSFVRGEDEISVEVSTSADDISSGKTISIVPNIPETIFYENSPLYGIMYEKALKDIYYLKDEEVVLHPVFYDLSIINADGNFITQWYIDDQIATGFSNKREITIRKNNQAAGESTISLKAQHQKKIMQGADANIRIIQ